MSLSFPPRRSSDFLRSRSDGAIRPEIIGVGEAGYATVDELDDAHIASRCRPRAADTSARPSHRGRTLRAGSPALDPPTNDDVRLRPRSDCSCDYSYEEWKSVV